MITAEEARKKSEVFRKEKREIRLNVVEELVEKAMTKGETEIWFPFLLTKDTEQELEKLGYTVGITTQYNETSYRVSW